MDCCVGLVNSSSLPIFSTGTVQDNEDAYIRTKFWTSAVNSGADIGIIALGTNDAKDEYWQGTEPFASAYRTIIELALDTFKIVCLSVPIPQLSEYSHWSNTSIINKVLPPAVYSLAQEYSLPLIDARSYYYLHAANATHSILNASLYEDPIHPNALGYRYIAKATKDVLDRIINLSVEPSATSVPQPLSFAPTLIPTRSPWTATPTASPVHTPTEIPDTKAPVGVPSTIPLPAPSAMPSGAPQSTPTAVPVSLPTLTPLALPTAIPTLFPTTAPKIAPTSIPQHRPTALPTPSPTPIIIQTLTAMPMAAPTTMPHHAFSPNPDALSTTMPVHAPTAPPQASPSMTTFPLPTGTSRQDGFSTTSNSQASSSQVSLETLVFVALGGAVIALLIGGAYWYFAHCYQSTHARSMNSKARREVKKVGPSGQDSPTSGCSVSPESSHASRKRPFFNYSKPIALSAPNLGQHSRVLQFSNSILRDAKSLSIPRRAIRNYAATKGVEFKRNTSRASFRSTTSLSLDSDGSVVRVDAIHTPRSSNFVISSSSPMHSDGGPRRAPPAL